MYIITITIYSYDSETSSHLLYEACTKFLPGETKGRTKIITRDNQ